MTSTLQTYRGVFDVLVSKLQADILQANTEGQTSISNEDLQKVFALLSGHANTVSVNGWESLQLAIKADTAAPVKKTRKK